MTSPKAVLISDIHFNITTLPVASAALKQAVDKANELCIPLIIAGDMHDTKAHIRGECIKAMKDIITSCYQRVYVIRGNHDSIHEKSTEHSLEFLSGLDSVYIVDKEPRFCGDILAIPYYSNLDELREALKDIPKGSTIVMHQGLNGSESGEYIQDKSALNKEDLVGFRVISGHYHRRQTIDLPGGGKFDYLGNPYTLGFGESNDPEKGFQILMDDDSLEFVPTDLRKHVILDLALEDLNGEAIFIGDGQDLVWVKIRGSKEELSKLTKDSVAESLYITQSFKLDLIPNDQKVVNETAKQNLSQTELLDTLIDSLSNTTNNTKERLKSTWKSFLTKE